MVLKSDQSKAFELLKSFISDPESSVFILKGYAGTGKTTMMSVLIDELKKRDLHYSLLASTGRAAKILSDKTQKDTTTVHGKIYSYKGLNRNLEDLITERSQTDIDKTGQILINFELTAPYKEFDGDKIHYYIIDEASMISDIEDKNATQALFGSGKLLTDLMNYDKNGKFIFVGDLCQLPPVLQSVSPALSATYFKETFQIDAIEFEMTEIVRQNSGNGIIDSSKLVRKQYASNPVTKWIKFPLRGFNNIVLYPDRSSLLRSYIGLIKQGAYNDSTLICQSNKNCLNLTELIRPSLNFDNARILPRDLLLVTQNNYLTGLMNGDMVEITQIGVREQRAGLTFVKVEVKELFTQKLFSLMMIEDIVYGTATNLTQNQQKELFIDFYLRMKSIGVKQDSDDFSQRMMKDSYLNALRAVFGYALTCHKSQGGEWDDVFLDIGKSIQFYNRPAVFQWIYTAMTRARKQLHIVDEWWIC